MVVEFSVAGKPQPKERPRVTAFATYTPKATVVYEAAVKQAYRKKYKGIAFPEGIPLRCELKAYMPIPKSDSKKVRQQKLEGKIRPVGRIGDVENIAKSVMDAANKVIYYDDSQVVELIAEKWYSDAPRTEVKIVDISEDIC